MPLRWQCSHLAKKYPCLNSLTLRNENLSYERWKFTHAPIIPPNDTEELFLMKDGLSGILQHPFNHLKSLTVDVTDLSYKVHINAIKKQIPALEHMFVLSYKANEPGTKEQFANYWNIMSPVLKTITWHHAPISDETVKEISDFVKSTKTLTLLDLTGANVSQNEKTRLQDAAASNEEIALIV